MSTTLSLDEVLDITTRMLRSSGASRLQADATARSIRDAENTIAYVNQYVASSDVVLAPPHVAWMVDAQVADFQQAVAYTGGRTQNYPRDLDQSRFLFDCSVQNATYAVLWDGWQEWAGKEMPDVDQVFRVIESWPVIYERGEWRVFANPAGQPDRVPVLLPDHGLRSMVQHPRELN